jgi:hypothetical protein
MKCALELYSIREDALKKKRLEELKKDEECRARQNEIAKYSIQFCENYIGKELEKDAQKGLQPSLYIEGNVIKDRLGKEYFCPLVEEPRNRYADGKRSYTIDRSKTIDLEVVRNYLAQFCFMVNTSHLEYYHYGFGKQDGIKLKITVNPECLDID